MNHAPIQKLSLLRTAAIAVFISCSAWAQQNSPTPSPATAQTSSPTTPTLTTPPIPVSGMNVLGGRIFNIEPGVAFNSLAPFLQPGDEVRLLPGVHIPFALADLRGARDNPIVIRGYQPEKEKPLPYVKGDLFSISLLRPQNVIVRDLLLGNSSGPTIYVDGSLAASPVVQETPWDSNLILTNLRIKQDGVADNQSGIYLRSMQKVDVSHIFIKGWNNSAIVLDNCKKVGVSQATLDTAKNLPQYRGVAIRSGCEDISCMYLSFGPKVQVAFELGVCDTTNPNPAEQNAQRPAQRIQISHNAALDCPCFISLGSIDNSTIANNSIIESTKFVWKADGTCGVPNHITFQNNLVTWVPGRIEKISSVAATIPPESIILQSNLWWSEELPIGFEIVGKPFGVEMTPQVFDVNPKVEMRKFVPVDEKARTFGWATSEDTNPPEAPKTPVESANPSQKPS